MTLRYYQSNLLAAIDATWASVPNVLAVGATGMGKTRIAAEVLSREPGASVFIAHRTELVSQASLALARVGVRHRVVGPDALRRTCAAIHVEELGRSWYDPNAKTAVAGVDTLVRMVPTDPWIRQVRLWVCDEAHHLCFSAPGKPNKWAAAASMFPDARGLGLTATPLRADGKGLGRHADGLVDRMVLGPPMAQLIAEGWLTKYRIFAPPNGLDLSTVPTSAGGDYSPDPLRKAVHKAHITGDIVAHYQRLADQKLGMTFCVDIESAVETADGYRSAGVAAEVITGKTPDFLRSRIMRRFRARQVLQLVSVDIMGEGTDVPAVEVVSMARPTQSYGLFVQQFGRALRPMDSKTHALIIDHVGNVFHHGLPDTPREWSLDRRDRRAKSGPTDAIPVRTCINATCLSVYERVLGACPYCGTTPPPPSSRGAPEQVDGDLFELDALVLAQMRGEIARIDRPAIAPHGASGPIRGAIERSHWERQQAQRPLREALALWGGWQIHLGRDLAEAQRRFFFRYGVDVGTAATLSATEANALHAQVTGELARHGVVAA